MKKAGSFSPAISVIVPVYNVAPYLPRALDSLLAQSFGDIEIICIDDASTDGSLQILRRYAERDARVKVIATAKNGGAARARNAGLEAATGKYVSFVDPDDAVSPAFYEVLYRLAEESGADLAKGLWEMIGSAGDRRVFGNGEIRRKGVWCFTFQWQSAIYAKRLLDTHCIRFADEIIKGQDVVFLNRVTMSEPTPKIVLSDDVKYLYYLREDSLNAPVLSPEKLRSAMEANRMILRNINASRVFEVSPENYLHLYFQRLLTILTGIFRQCGGDVQRQRVCIEGFLELFYQCRDVEKLKKRFRRRFFSAALYTGSPEDVRLFIVKHSQLITWKRDLGRIWYLWSGKIRRLFRKRGARGTGI
ncbi:MAG: glycosyltransferase [Victivallaceae bacterium]|nr:glycosyltransferase [Victivallaceae bacterium]